MKINDASRATGVSRDMIRFYEKQGLVCPARLPNGYRDYSDEDLYLLTVIRYLSNLGVPLRVISTAFESGQTDLLVGNLKDEISRLTLLRSQIEVRIAAAKESIACFNLLSSGTPWEVYEAPARYLFSFGSLRYPVYRSGPEPGDSFAFYYRQREESITHQADEAHTRSSLTGKTEFTVLMHQFFQKKGEAAFLSADILLG